MNDVRSYLLGASDEATSESIETRALQDAEFFETIRSVEDDLFDQFARGELSEDERAAFLRQFGQQSDRIRFADALARRRPNVVAFPARRWLGWAAAAAIAIAVTALVVRQPAAPRVAVHSQVLRSMDVTLAIGATRSSSQSTQVVVPNGISTVNLRVRLNPADRYEKYVMTLRSKGVSWGSSDVKTSNDAGDLIVAAKVPAKILVADTYELSVSGDGEELGFATLEVRPQK